MGESFLFCSGKGGVGKTSSAINLSFALAELGRRVALVDVNVPNPNIAFHLKIPDYVETLNELMQGKKQQHKIPGYYNWRLRIVPAAFSVRAMESFDLRSFSAALKGICSETDVMMLDSAPGLGAEVVASLEVSDKVVIVTNPEIPALADAAKTIHIANDRGIEVSGVIVNRVGRFRHELKRSEILNVIDNVPILGEIPEDPFVSSAVRSGQPVVLKYPASKAAREYKRIASKLIGEKFVDRTGVVDRLQLFLEKFKPV